MEPGGHGEPKADQIKILNFFYLPKQYEGFVKGKWKTSLKRGNPYFRLQDSKPYYDAYEAYINAIFARHQTSLRVAVLADNLDVALGWSVITGSTLHYAYVHADYRGLGLARTLVPCPIERITHLTIVGRSIWRKKLPHAKFDMFA